MNNTTQEKSLSGVLYTILAFLIWGFGPIYWKVLHTIAALEIITHRVIWSFLFLLIALVFNRQLSNFMMTMKNWRTFLILIPTTILISLNWLIYIWAVNHDHILEASLGYFITPLVNVLLGMIFLKERLRLLQTVSLVLAGIGVSYLTIYYGAFPWISLSLAFAFGFYGLIRKVASVSSLVGLSVEMLLLVVPAVAYIVFLNRQGTGAIFSLSVKIDLFLMGTAFVTALPLLLFTLGARRLTLSTVGFLQYIAPTCMFVIGAFLYGEPISSVQILTFILIWAALLLYSADSVVVYKTARSINKVLFRIG